MPPIGLNMNFNPYRAPSTPPTPEADAFEDYLRSLKDRDEDLFIGIAFAVMAIALIFLCAGCGSSDQTGALCCDFPDGTVYTCEDGTWSHDGEACTAGAFEHEQCYLTRDPLGPQGTVKLCP